MVTEPVEVVKLIIDGMSIARQVKPESTYAEYFRKLFSAMLPKDRLSVESVDIIMDNYLEHSTKEFTRAKRGENQLRTHITDLTQKMPLGALWQDFLSKKKNKNDLIKLFVEYLKTPEFRNSLSVAVIITEQKKTWKISRETVEELFESNHEEADSRMVLP